MDALYIEYKSLNPSEEIVNPEPIMLHQGYISHNNIIRVANDLIKKAHTKPENDEADLFAKAIEELNKTYNKLFTKEAEDMN